MDFIVFFLDLTGFSVFTDFAITYKPQKLPCQYRKGHKNRGLPAGEKQSTLTVKFIAIFAMNKKRKTKGKQVKSASQKTGIAKQNNPLPPKSTVQAEGTENTVKSQGKPFTVAEMLQKVRERAVSGQMPVVNGEAEAIRKWDKQSKAIEKGAGEADAQLGIRRTRSTRKAWQRAFLWHYAHSNNVYCSARMVGINPSLPDVYARRHPKFAAAMEEAHQEAVQYLELCAWLRATEGTIKPVFMKDENGVPKQIGHFREYSDRLTEFLLGAENPGKYRQSKNQVEISGPNGGPITQQNAVIILPANGRDQLETLRPVQAIPESVPTADKPTIDKPADPAKP